MTDEEFTDKYGKLSKEQRNFLDRYLIYFDVDKAWVPGRMGDSKDEENRKKAARKMWKKTKDLIYYIIKRDGYLEDFFNEASLKNKMIELYSKTEDERIKLSIIQEGLKLLGKIENAVAIKGENVTIKFE